MLLKNSAGIPDAERLEMRRRRMELRYQAYLKKTSHSRDNDTEGEWLLEELQGLRQHPDQQDPFEVKEDRLRAAMILWRRGDLVGRANELWEITKLDADDVEALFLYGLGLRDLETQPNLDDKYRENLHIVMAQLLREAERRLGKLNEVGLLGDNEARTWNERFQSLRLQ